MSQETLDFTQEPKKVFLGFLIDRMKVANYFIFIAGQDARGWDILDGVIKSLNEDCQKHLTKQTEALEGAMYNRQSCTSQRTRKIYAEIYMFLTKTYFEECNFTTVPTAALKGPTDAPTKKIERRASATL